MDREVFEVLVKVTAMLISVLITGVIIPWVRANISAQKLAKIEKYAEVAVRCAEQLFTEDEWKKKKQYASEYVANKVAEMGIELSVDDINVLVESTVNLIKYGTEYNK